jgi:hypothetical protein
MRGAPRRQVHGKERCRRQHGKGYGKRQLLPRAVMGMDADIGMDAEAGRRHTAPSGRDGESFQIAHITDFRDAPAVAISRET